MKRTPLYSSRRVASAVATDEPGSAGSAPPNGLGADAPAQPVPDGNPDHRWRAMARPALYRLLWLSERPDFRDADLGQAARAAFQHLVDQVSAAGGGSTADEGAVWAMAHGLADLLAAGRLESMLTLPADSREAMIKGILRRALPFELGLLFGESGLDFGVGGQRGDANHAAPDMHHGHLRAQRHAAHSRLEVVEDHAHDAAVADDFKAVEMLGRELDAHPHGGEQERGQQHPEGLPALGRRSGCERRNGQPFSASPMWLRYHS